ncbi:MAG: hypothetical protein WAK28_07870 [Trebonia sp.]
MTEPSPYIDVANLPAPAEGIVVTMFITVAVWRGPQAELPG